MGFTKLQHSKIKQLNIEKDFEKIFVIDPSASDLTKKDIFRKILSDYDYKAKNLLVVGDDLNSEIKAAKELGIETVLYIYKSAYTEAENQRAINNFKDLEVYL
jgi:putative hydrolase of the HAD superfamily